MNHLMLAKFKPEYSKEQITKMFVDIQNIYNNAKTIQGVYDVEYHINCIDRPNRYDIYVNIIMDKETLSLWDACEWHMQWKTEYSHMLESKCIFDYE